MKTSACRSLDAYEWPVLAALKYMLLSFLTAVFLLFFLLQEWFRGSHALQAKLVNYIHLTLDVHYGNKLSYLVVIMHLGNNSLLVNH